MSRFEEVQAENLQRRERVIEGKFNCLPFPFKRFSKIYPGFEQARYLILTANQKIGKSKLADYLFIYEPLFNMLDKGGPKVKVFYFSLEMSAREKYNEFLCQLLFRLDNIHIDTRRLRSVDAPCDPHVFELLQSDRYQRYIQAFEEMVLFDDVTKNPTGINKKCRDYALTHGHMNFVEYAAVNEITGDIEKKKGVDPIKPYTQDNEDEFRIIILDNAANLTVEKGCKDQRETIEKMSKYCIILRKQLNYIPVLIQHQSQSQEGIENIKLDRMKPTTDGLGDCKTTSRDASCIIGLYSPYKFEKKEHLKYDITKLKGYCRFLEVLEDRDYGANGHVCPLFFDGATSTFKELPKATDTAGLNRYYQLIQRWESEENTPQLELTNPK